MACKTEREVRGVRPFSQLKASKFLEGLKYIENMSTENMQNSLNFRIQKNFLGKWQKIVIVPIYYQMTLDHY